MTIPSSTPTFSFESDDRPTGREQVAAAVNSRPFLQLFRGFKKGDESSPSSGELSGEWYRSPFGELPKAKWMAPKDELQNWLMPVALQEACACMN
jgi:hypothetical protein